MCSVIWRRMEGDGRYLLKSNVCNKPLSLSLFFFLLSVSLFLFLPLHFSLQCLKFSIFKHNRIYPNSGRTELSATVDSWKLRQTKITLYKVQEVVVFKVFQRRHDGTEDFVRTWMEYKNGFGDSTSEFWFGTCLICHFLCQDFWTFHGGFN